MEKWDLYDKEGNKLNKTIERGSYLTDEEYHLVTNAWIKNDKGEFLISQRVPSKPHPLMWECTGGSVIAGEDSYLGAIREAQEELGVDLKNAKHKFIGKTNRYYKGCPDILEVWLFEQNIPIEKIKIQEEEVNDAKWATPEEILKLYEENKFEANVYFKEIITGKYKI